MALALVREDHRLVVRADVAELALHCEAIHLCFGQRVGPAKLHRVLGCDHEEHTVEIVALALDGYLALAHGFQQRALGAG